MTDRGPPPKGKTVVSDDSNALDDETTRIEDVGMKDEDDSDLDIQQVVPRLP